jgi:hypothetical protein
MKSAALALMLVLVAQSAFAEVADVLRDYVGYRIVASKTIVGYKNKDGTTGDTFEGCEDGRVILFEDKKSLTCAGTGYQYAYRPIAIILSRGSSLLMIVGDDAYDMRR